MTPAFSRVRFDEFDEDFGFASGGDEEEIDASAISAGTRGGIDGLGGKTFAKDLSGAIQIGDRKFDLLNALAEASEEAFDGAAAALGARGENIHANTAGKIQRELLCVLIRRHVREWRRAGCGADFVEGTRFDGNADGDFRQSRIFGERETGGEGAISEPAYRGRDGKIAAGLKELRGSAFAARGAGGA